MKKKLFLPILVAFLSIALLAPLFIEATNAAYIFSDGFESGTLTSWSSFSGTLYINNQTVNSGVYSVENIVVGSNENLYNQSLGGSLPNPINLREYVYINSTSVPSTNGDYYEVGGFSAIGRADFGDGEICIFNIAGTLYWGLYYRDLSSIPSGFSHVISSDNKTSDAHPVSIGWNSVELQSTTGTIGVNGEEQLYLNGVSIIDVSANNYDRTPYNVVIGGSQSVANAANSWNYYIDDVVVSGSYIGPIQYQLTTSTNYGTVSPPSGPYAEGANVTISAAAPAAAQGERYIWQGWVGSGVGSYTGLNNPATVTMVSSAITEQAVWEHQYYLTVSSVNGTIGGAGWYDNGTTAYASIAPLTVPGATGTQYVFTGWSGDASGATSPSNVIIMTGPKTATANWQTQYYLNVSSSHGTSGGSGWYNSSASAYASTPLVVAGATGTQYVFTGWSGDASGATSPSNAINMTGPETAIANWNTQYMVTIAQSGVGSDFSGAVMTVNGTSYNSTGFAAWANPGDIYNFTYSSPLVVTANGEQYLLTVVSGNGGASSFTVTQATTITGSYKTQYYLTITSAHDSPSPANGWYDSGSSISAFVASPVPFITGTQYVCTGWSGTGSVPASGSTSAVTFTINAPSTIVWNWQQTPTSTPTPTPTPAHTPTPTPSPSKTASPTPKPTNSSPTPKSSQSTQSPGINVYIYGLVIAIVVVGIIAAVMVIRRRNQLKSKVQP
ncbi:MAG: hypothetical protein ABSA75_11665 [Candidatus Bathyarchaeia archaeon]|jgi:uncharacterized repeat protein (TIGR02543 family)